MHDVVKREVVSSLEAYFARARLEVDVYLSGSLARDEYNTTESQPPHASDVDVICFVATQAEGEPNSAFARHVADQGLPIADRLILALADKSNLPANCMLSIDFDKPIHKGTAAPLAQHRNWTTRQYLAYQLQPFALYGAVAMSPRGQGRANTLLRKSILAAMKAIFAVETRRTSGFIFEREVMSGTIDWTRLPGSGPAACMQGSDAELLGRILALKEVLLDEPQFRSAIDVLGSTSMYFHSSDVTDEIVDAVHLENNGFRSSAAYVG